MFCGSTGQDGPGARCIAHDPGTTYTVLMVTVLQYSAVHSTISWAERAAFQGLADRCRQGPDTPRRIYLSRLSVSRQNPQYRRLVNELELIDLLARSGFVTFEPERHDFAEQVRWLADADIVIGPGGSGIYNTVFCRPTTRVVTVEASPTFVTSHTGLFAALNLWYGVIYGEPVEPGGGVHASWRVNLALVRRALEHTL